MGIHAGDFRDQIIVPALRDLGMLSAAAVNLLLGTCAQESHFCEIGLVQRGGGPALGPYQMEPPTFHDTWDRAPATVRPIVLRFVPDNGLVNGRPDPRLMVTDLRFATMIARIKYRLAPPALPAADDQDGLWAYYKKWWNSTAGAATRDQWDANWSRYAASVAVSRTAYT